MKVRVEDVSPVKKVMHVEIPEDEVDRELGKAYKTLKNTVKLKGFRPGKVPLSLLEKRFKKEVQAEVSGELIQNSYGEALKEVELKPVSEPTLDRPELERGKAYKYSATIEVSPPLDDLKVEGLKLTKKVCHVDDEEIETQLKIIQKRSAQLKDVEEDRPVRIHDIVIIDYEGFKDGNPLQAARKTENFQVEIGSGRILEDFEKKIVGMHRDATKEVEVCFPEDYYNKDLAGMEVTFKVTLKEIKEEILPDLDDDFAKDLGDYDTLEDLKKAVAENLQQAYDGQCERQLRTEIMDQLIAQCEFELPESMVEKELEGIVGDARGLMASRGVPLEKSSTMEEELSEKYRSLAQRKVREALLIQKVIDQKDITLSDEMLDKAYEKFGTALGQPVEMIKEYHSTDKEARELFENKTLQKQAIKYLIDNSEIKTVEVKKEELRGGFPEGSEGQI